MSTRRSPTLTFHDLWDPLTENRVSLRIDAGHVTDRQASLPGSPTAPAAATPTVADIDGSDLWILPGLYDADQQTPFLSAGFREADRFAALTGGITTLNVAVSWQDVRDLDLAAIAQKAAAQTMPQVIPILSVGDVGSEGFGDWIMAHAETVASLFPPICKLYSADPNFFPNLDAVWASGLLPIVYCYDDEALQGVVERAKAPLHFRHASSGALAHTMRQVPGATLQTSPHFLLPIPDEVRARLWVLPPVSDEAVRATLLEVFLDQIDLLVTDHNAAPFRGNGTGPGLSVAHTLLPAALTVARLNDWPLERVLAKATSAPAARFGITLRQAFTIVDPNHHASPDPWPRQTPDRAPYAATPLYGRVLAAGTSDEVVLV